MSDPNDERPPDPQNQMIGAAVAIGAGVGAAMFVVFDSPVWIAVGVALGAAVGSASQRRRP